MKKLISLLVCCTFILCAASGYGEIKNPDTFIKATVSTIRTVDPAAAYDMASMQKVENIYEKLIAFDGPYTDKFVPLLAEEVPSLENGGISADGKTYTFKVRKGIKFHQGGDLTPEDVDTAMREGMGYPRGLLTWADEIGLDVVAGTLEGLLRHRGDERYRPAPLLRQKIFAGQLGKKTGRGFYAYDGQTP